MTAYVHPAEYVRRLEDALRRIITEGERVLTNTHWDAYSARQKELLWTVNIAKDALAACPRCGHVAATRHSDMSRYLNCGNAWHTGQRYPNTGSCPDCGTWVSYK